MYAGTAHCSCYLEAATEGAMSVTSDLSLHIRVARRLARLTVKGVPRLGVFRLFNAFFNTRQVGVNNHIFHNAIALTRHLGSQHRDPQGRGRTNISSRLVIKACHRSLGLPITFRDLLSVQFHPTTDLPRHLHRAT